MNLEEAAKKLKEMYNDPSTDKAVSIHLFAIKYADEIEGLNPKEIVVAAGLGESYQAEINKGKNLSEYVQLKSRTTS